MIPGMRKQSQSIISIIKFPLTAVLELPTCPHDEQISFCDINSLLAIYL